MSSWLSPGRHRHYHRHASVRCNCGASCRAPISPSTSTEMTNEDRPFRKDCAGDGLDRGHRQRHRQGAAPRPAPEVGVNGRGQAKVDAAIAAIAKAVPGAKVRGIAGDVSTSAGCKALLAALPDVDILVNNAGIFEPKDFLRHSRRGLEPLLRGQRDVRRAAVARLQQGMLKRNWGRIVFISSESGLNIPTEMIHYGMTKTAQPAIARGLAGADQGHRGHRQLGAARTDDVRGRRDLRRGSRQAERPVGRGGGRHTSSSNTAPTSLLQRFASTEEIANLVVYTCSKQASATNGAALRAEGGIVNTIA